MPCRLAAISLALLVPLLVATGCQVTGPRAATPGHEVCATLFGRPNHHTGLSELECSPRCGDYVEPEYTHEFESRLHAWELAEPIPDLTSDPYVTGVVDPHASEGVCGVVRTSESELRYRLVDYTNEAEAEAAGASITHHGRCGVCSTLQDLAVYMAHDDLTTPVRHCGIWHHAGSERDVECLEQLGFTRPCAQIWAYNNRHTREVCLRPCVVDLVSHYNERDGSLNRCLRCDEERSGPMFKTVAGRTRRNTGLANAMCRPCDEVRPIVHAYE